MENEKFCPLGTTGFIAAGDERNALCHSDMDPACCWWDETAQQCGILTAVNCIRTISRELVKINKRNETRHD